MNENKIEPFQIHINGTKVEMQIPQYMEKPFKEAPYFLELEMLRGERTEMPDGGIKYKINIQDIEKMVWLKDFFLKLFSRSHDGCKN